MNEKDNNLDLRRFWRAVKQCKWIYIAAILIFTTLGVIKSLRSLPNYEIEGSMLIGEIGYDQDSRSGGIAQMMKTFSVGGFSASTVDNEVLIMQSHDVLLRTVKTLNLNRSYIGKNADGEKSILYTETPIKVDAPSEYFDTLSTSFNLKVKINKDSKIDIKVTKGILGSVKKEIKGATVPFMLETPYGNLQIIPTDSFKDTPYKEITVAITNNDIAANTLDNNLVIDVASKMADIINVDYDCANPDLGKITVNGIMNEYNAKRLDRLHEAAVASIKYYDERINETFRVLQDAEKEVSEYQRKNELMGIDSELELLVGNSVGAKQEIQTANYNIAYYETILNILRNRLDDDVIIPQMESLNDPNIGAFNGAIQARRELRRSATENNEALKLLNEKIEELRNLIIENSSKMIAKAKADLGHTQGLAASAHTRLDKYPDYQLEFMNLLRKKEYQNQLYQFLVSQRENSVLQLYSSTNIGFIYQDAYVVKKSGLLKKLIWPVALFVLAVLIVTGLAIFIMLLSDKIKDPMDLAYLRIDDHAVKYDGNAEALYTVRNMIIANPERRVIYFNALDATASIRNLFVNSLTAIGRNVEVIEGFTSNNDILTPTTEQQIKEAIASNDYVIIDIAEPDEVSNLTNAIAAKDAVMLMSIPSGKISRRSLKTILKGQRANKIYSIICKQ